MKAKDTDVSSSETERLCFYYPLTQAFYFYIYVVRQWNKKSAGSTLPHDVNSRNANSVRSLLSLDPGMQRLRIDKVTICYSLNIYIDLHCSLVLHTKKNACQVFLSYIQNWTQLKYIWTIRHQWEYHGTRQRVGRKFVKLNMVTPNQNKKPNKSQWSKEPGKEATSA